MHFPVYTSLENVWSSALPSYWRSQSALPSCWTLQLTPQSNFLTLMWSVSRWIHLLSQSWVPLSFNVDQCYGQNGSYIRYLYPFMKTSTSQQSVVFSFNECLQGIKVAWPKRWYPPPPWLYDSNHYYILIASLLLCMWYLNSFGAHLWWNQRSVPVNSPCVQWMQGHGKKERTRGEKKLIGKKSSAPEPVWIMWSMHSLFFGTDAYVLIHTCIYSSYMHCSHVFIW